LHIADRNFSSHLLTTIASWSRFRYSSIKSVLGSATGFWLVLGFSISPIFSNYLSDYINIRYSQRLQPNCIYCQHKGTKIIWSEVLTPTNMALLWVVAPCGLIWVYQRFWGLPCLDQQSDEILLLIVFRAWLLLKVWISLRLIHIYLINDCYLQCGQQFGHLHESLFVCVGFYCVGITQRSHLPAAVPIVRKVCLER
jgi:hypothetical protein